MFFSCVEFIKRVLGIHSCFILTPWQLYKYLNKEKEKVGSTPADHPLSKGNLSWVV